jgi:hypothetical protein
MLSTAKITAATQTIEGPAGVSNMYANRSLTKADTLPIPAATKAILSGVRLRGLAAAGMINIGAIINTPTTLIATATVMANAIVRTSCSRFGLIPLA